MVEPNCYNCVNRRLCFLKRAIQDTITKYVGIINVDSIHAVEESEALYKALAVMCQEFKEE